MKYLNQMNVDELGDYIPLDYIRLLKKYGIKNIKRNFDEPISLEVVIEIIKMAKEMDHGYLKRKCT